MMAISLKAAAESAPPYRMTLASLILSTRYPDASLATTHISMITHYFTDHLLCVSS